MTTQRLEKLAELAKAVPASHKQAATSLVERMGEVIEGLSDEPMEWRPTTLKLVQATSDRSKLPKGATIGSLVLGEEIQTPPIKVIPLRAYTTRQYWNPDQTTATMICSSPDAKTGFRYGSCKTCPHSKFDEEAKRSDCNKTLTFIAVKEDLSNVFLINFSKTNYANGIDWQGLMKKAGVSPYKRVYSLTPETSSKAKNVEVLKAQPIMENGAPVAVDAKVMPFVEELFRLATKDRDTSLKQFQEYLINKKDASVLMLDNQADEGGGTVTLITASEAAASSEASGYKL